MAQELPKSVRYIIEELLTTSNKSQEALLDRLVRTLDATMVPTVSGGGMMKVESMISSRTQNPVVIFTWGTNRGELGPIEARGYALQILEACEASVQDASLYRAIMDTSGAKLGHAEAEELALSLIGLIRSNRSKFEEGDE